MLRVPLLVLILGLLAGCGEPQGEVRVGSNRWLGYAPFYLADEQGWLQSERVRLVEYPHTTGVLRGYRNGLLDAALLTLDEALTLQSTGYPVRILLVADVSAGADVLFARQQLRQLTDLRGRRIGVENSALGAYFLSRLLDQAGLKRREVRVVDMPVNEHLAALRQGRIDAAINFASATQAFAQQGAYPLLDSRALPNEIIDVLVFNPQRLDAARSEQLRTLWHRGLEAWVEQRGRHDPTLQRRLELQPGELEVTLAGLRMGDTELNRELNERGVLRDSLHRLNLYLLERQLISRPANIDAMLGGCAGPSC